MYEIKILNNEDFKRVAKSDPRYSFVDDTNLGFADKAKRVAYVRQTNVHDLNKYLVTHELEELENDSSTHEDANGIRHKKFFKEFLLPAVIAAAKGGATGGQMGAATGVLDTYQNLFSKNTTGSYTPPPQTGSYSPLNSFGNTNGMASGSLPSSFTGSYSPTITNGGINSTDMSKLPDEVKQQQRGFYSGRLTF